MSRLRRWWVVVGGVLVLSAGWWGPPALRPFSFFAVRRIEVIGTRYLEPATVVAALRLGPKASVWADTKAMERRLAEVAGVRSATVARRLPSSLVVKVVEMEPVALAEGPTGLVPVDDSGRPLPYDPAVAPVDVPVIERAAAPLAQTLAAIRATDYGLFADITAARAAAGGGGDVVLDLDNGRVRLTTPLDPVVVRAVSAVRRDLAARGQNWQELDGRFRGWVVVRRPEVERATPKPPRATPKAARPSRHPARSSGPSRPHRPARPARRPAPGAGAA